MTKKIAIINWRSFCIKHVHYVQKFQSDNMLWFEKMFTSKNSSRFSVILLPPARLWQLKVQHAIMAKSNPEIRTWTPQKATSSQIWSHFSLFHHLSPLAARGKESAVTKTRHWTAAERHIKTCQWSLVWHPSSEITFLMCATEEVMSPKANQLNRNADDASGLTRTVQKYITADREVK